jgi:hypothetical protein
MVLDFLEKFFDGIATASENRVWTGHAAYLASHI